MTQSGRTGSRRIQDSERADREQKDTGHVIKKNDSEREDREQKDTGHV